MTVTGTQGLVSCWGARSWPVAAAAVAGSVEGVCAPVGLGSCVPLPARVVCPARRHSVWCRIAEGNPLRSPLGRSGYYGELEYYGGTQYYDDSTSVLLGITYLWEIKSL